MLAEYSPKTSLTCQTSATSETCEASNATSSREDSHASPTLSLESETVTPTIAHSGLKCSASYASQSRLGCWVKMCLESSAWNSTKSALTWKRKATKSNRCLFQLAPPTRRTSGCAAGYWPTLRAQEDNRSPAAYVRMQAKRGRKPTDISSLSVAVKLAESRENGSLNPEWAEWLMGYPIGWTDCVDSATPSCRK